MPNQHIKTTISAALLLLVIGCATDISSSVQEPAAAPTATSTDNPADNSTEQRDTYPVPPLPDSLPAPRYQPELADQATVNILDETDLSLGVGQLRPKDLSEFSLGDPLASSGWLGEVQLPLYQSPAGEPWGWLAGGWVLRPDPTTGEWEPDSRPFTMLGIVYQGTVNSLVVLDIRPDGWFQLRYAEPTAEHDGTAWAHTSHLDLSGIAIALEPWEEWFTAEPRLFYLRGGPHALQAEPSTTSEALLQLGEPGTPENSEPYALTPLAFEGDWMQVRVSVPGDVCSPLTEPQEGESYEGWLRWRNPEQGTVLWHYTSC